MELPHFALKLVLLYALSFDILEDLALIQLSRPNKKYLVNEVNQLAFQYYMTLWVGIGGIGLVVGREWENFMALPVGVSGICLVVGKE